MLHPKASLDEKAWELRVESAYRELQAARQANDTLRVALLEEALNDLLESHSCNT